MTGEEFGIDELARRAGTTVRNVRLYAERGLLPPPRRVGRAARYGPHHLARLELVLRLLGRGYPLAAIKELLAAWESQRGLGDVLGLEDALGAPFEIEPPRRFTREELIGLFPDGDFDEGLARAVDIGLLVPDQDGWWAPVPTFLEGGAELAATGLPTGAVLDLAAATRRAAAELADAFVSAFMEHVWGPFEAAGQPAEQLPRIVEAINRQRPLAEQVVRAALGQAMQERVDRAIMDGAGAP